MDVPCYATGFGDITLEGITGKRVAVVNIETEEA